MSDIDIKAQVLSAARNRILQLQEQMTDKVLQMAAEVGKLMEVAPMAEAKVFLKAMTELLTQLVEGGLSKVSFHEAQKFGGVRVSYLELREKRASPYPGYLHYEDVALLAQIPVALARTLMEHETIPATWIPLAELPRTYRVMSPKMFERFTSENVSVYALAKNMGLVKKSVVAKLKGAGIKPSISFSDQEPVFYLRHEASA
jgi:hypothetical protein